MLRDEVTGDEGGVELKRNTQANLQLLLDPFRIFPLFKMKHIKDW
jgi:hypothetical protein